MYYLFATAFLLSGYAGCLGLFSHYWFTHSFGPSLFEPSVSSGAIALLIEPSVSFEPSRLYRSYRALN